MARKKKEQTGRPLREVVAELVAGELAKREASSRRTQSSKPSLTKADVQEVVDRAIETACADPDSPVCQLISKTRTGGNVTVTTAPTEEVLGRAIKDGIEAACGDPNSPLCKLLSVARGTPSEKPKGSSSEDVVCDVCGKTVAEVNFLRHMRENHVEWCREHDCEAGKGKRHFL